MLAALGLPLASASGSDWAVAAGAGVILLYAVLSRRLDATPVTAAIFFVTGGFLLGSHGAGSPQQFELGDQWLVGLAGHLSDEREPP